MLYRRHHPAPNRLPEDIRGKVVALKRENRGRSNPLIADLIPPKTDIIKQAKDKRRIMFFDPPRISF